MSRVIDIAIKNKVDPRALIIDLCKVNKIEAPIELIEEIAQNLKSINPAPSNYHLKNIMVKNRLILSYSKKLNKIFKSSWNSESILSEEISLTYEELYNLANSLVEHLRSLGHKRGDKIAIRLPNGPEYCVAYFAYAYLKLCFCSS